MFTHVSGIGKMDPSAGSSGDPSHSEPGALPRLIDKYERAIRRFIAGRSGPLVLKRATVDDIFQETVAEALAMAPVSKLHDDGRFLRWIYTIAVRVISRVLAGGDARHTIVRIKGAQSSGVGVREADLGPFGRTPSSFVSQREQIEGLKTAIAQLPERYRQVITLYKIDQLPLDEVAKRMNQDKRFTSVLIFRGMKYLRNAMTSP